MMECDAEVTLAFITDLSSFVAAIEDPLLTRAKVSFP